MYKIKIAPKEGWLDMPKNITYVPFFGTLETNISDKTYKLFSFYYSIDKDTLRIDNIKFITQSPLFSLSKYKDIYYDYLFDALILHMKNCPYTKTLIKKLYISSQDAFSIEK